MIAPCLVYLTTGRHLSLLVTHHRFFPPAQYLPSSPFTAPYFSRLHKAPSTSVRCASFTLSPLIQTPDLSPIERNDADLTPAESVVETTKTELQLIWNGFRQEERDGLDFSLVFIFDPLVIDRARLSGHGPASHHRPSFRHLILTFV